MKPSRGDRGDASRGPRPAAGGRGRGENDGPRPRRAASDKPSGGKSFGERPARERPVRERPAGAKTFGPRPERSGKPAGGKLSTGKPAGGKPGRGRIDGDKPPRDHARAEGKPAFKTYPKRKPAPSVAPKTDGKRGPGSFDKRRMKPDKGHIWQPGPNARTIRSEAGQDLAHFLVHIAGRKISVRKARELLENGCCRIGGRIESFGSYVLKAGDVVEFILPDEDPEHRFDEQRVLHNDRCVLAYDKPPFLAVTPQDGRKSWSLFDILKASPVGKAAGVELFPVHRLDADTSGIVLFAKDQPTATRLEAMFRDHAVVKTYQAVVRGHPREEGLHRSYLIKVAARQGFEKWRSGRGDNAREAITTWTVETRLGKYGSLLKVIPKTGRYHQIRIHMSELGHSLYGDRLYGDRLDPVHVNRHLLHACEVHLPNPGSGPELKIKCPLPEDMVKAMEQIRKL